MVLTSLRECAVKKTDAKQLSPAPASRGEPAGLGSCRVEGIGSNLKTRGEHVTIMI